jgi:hypothetical protein
MLRIAKLLSKLTLIGLLSITSLRSSYGQKEINLSAGFGIPELLNIGIRGQVKQIVLGVSVGTVPGLPGDEKIFSVCGDIFYHFGKVPELSERRVWYTRVGVNYLSDKNNNWDQRFTYLNLRIGRDLNLSKKIGIQIDLGTLIELSKKIVPDSWVTLLFPAIVPSIGLNFFLRL